MPNGRISQQEMRWRLGTVWLRIDSWHGVSFGAIPPIGTRFQCAAAIRALNGEAAKE